MTNSYFQYPQGDMWAAREYWVVEPLTSGLIRVPSAEYCYDRELVGIGPEAQKQYSALGDGNVSQCATQRVCYEHIYTNDILMPATMTPPTNFSDVIPAVGSSDTYYPASSNAEICYTCSPDKEMEPLSVRKHRRREQNRLSQRKYRAEKENQIKKAREQIQTLQLDLSSLINQNLSQKKEIKTLQTELQMLRSSKH